MTLTTPVPRDIDAVFPGENWFFYWKTSSSLWQSKLQEFPSEGKIIVPLNWSFHTENGDQYDFAQKKPETDLKKLSQIAQELGKELVFFLPLGPAPFLPNGGIPSLLARSKSLNLEEMGYPLLDSDGSILRLYTFFDPRVYNSFSKFVKLLGRYISEQGMVNDVWGIECGRFEKQSFSTYFHDRSKVFSQGFSQFLKEKFNEKHDFDGDQDYLVKDPQKEMSYIKEFTETIRDIYLQAAQKSLNANWEGMLRISFLGGDGEDFFYRVNGKYSISKYAHQVFESLCFDTIPSSSLLPRKSKEGVLERILDDLVCKTTLKQKFDGDSYDGEDAGEFKNLVFFQLFDSKYDDLSSTQSAWKKLSLDDCIEQHYGWCYRKQVASQFQIDDDQKFISATHFFQGADLDTSLFNKVLKFFMMGGKVVVDFHDLDLVLKKRLESFFLENNLNVERISFHTSVQNITLGEGRLLLFDGSELSKLTKDKKEHFWKRLFETFDIFNLETPIEEGLFTHWKTRAAGGQELNYEEVRRLNFYNTSSYKRRFKISLKKNFALLKIIDQQHTQVNHQADAIEIEILPGGSVGLDFGIF